ncbi:TPA: DUF1366 domain-containing protein, partial [Streptococcus suis]|nr:DUF1366 domain-containing protein [Streptococcus suis]HEM5941229.1 DUF1366 domain-containing protein [Streptococcus suis]HEM5947513.1 DUF1366 domain-containing protein [Streptococcus suis]HEM5951679.1 DUF1366 domain-containing protein [Streptococcus suis]HEM5952889.1 DUF1366 domain-containing protein [Streptococcus suis]
MRTWNVVGKYPIYTDGVVSHTEIAIASTTGGYATYTEKVLGNHMDKPETELLELAREAYFKSEYADRAMAESVQKIDELEETTKEAKAFMENAADEFEAIKARQDTAEKERNDRFKALEADMQAKIDDAVAELTIMFSGFAGQFEETKVVEETPKDNSPHDV